MEISMVTFVAFNLSDTHSDGNCKRVKGAHHNLERVMLLFELLDGVGLYNKIRRNLNSLILQSLDADCCVFELFFFNEEFLRWDNGRRGRRYSDSFELRALF